VPLARDALAAGDTMSGCVFRARCPLALARCATETPLPRLLGTSLVACHRAGE